MRATVRRTKRSSCPDLATKELALLRDVKAVNDHPNGFRSFTISGGGSKGSNFHRINQEKIAKKLVALGMLELGTWGYEITDAGREAVAKEDAAREAFANSRNKGPEHG